MSVQSSRKRVFQSSLKRFRTQGLVRGLLALTLALCFQVPFSTRAARTRRAPTGGRTAVVVDERLAALRERPGLTMPLRQRLGRGRLLALLGRRETADGLLFYQVAVTRRTRGWVQREALISPSHPGDDERLLRLIRSSEGFDRIERARIFLDHYPKSPLRAAVLSLYGEAAEEAARKLSTEAARRLDEREMRAGGAPLHSYFLNYNGLDRFRKKGIVFSFDPATKQFAYDGAAWREILRRHPHSPEAAEAARRLDQRRTPGER